MKHCILILLSASLLTSCGSLLSGPPTTSVEDLILADAFGIRIPQPVQPTATSQEIVDLKAEIAALKEAK